MTNQRKPGARRETTITILVKGPMGRMHQDCTFICCSQVYIVGILPDTLEHLCTLCSTMFRHPTNSLQPRCLPSRLPCKTKDTSKCDPWLTWADHSEEETVPLKKDPVETVPLKNDTDESDEEDEWIVVDSSHEKLMQEDAEIEKAETQQLQDTKTQQEKADAPKMGEECGFVLDAKRLMKHEDSLSATDPRPGGSHTPTKPGAVHIVRDNEHMHTLLNVGPQGESTRIWTLHGTLRYKVSGLPQQNHWRYDVAFFVDRFDIEDLYGNKVMYRVQSGADCHITFDTIAVKNHDKFAKSFAKAQEVLSKLNGSRVRFELWKPILSPAHKTRSTARILSDIDSAFGVASAQFHQYPTWHSGWVDGEMPTGGLPNYKKIRGVRDWFDIKFYGLDNLQVYANWDLGRDRWIVDDEV